MTSTRKDNQETNLANEVIGTAAEMAAEAVLGPAGVLVSRYSKKLIDYWIDSSKKREESTSSGDFQKKRRASFVVVGLGRCGCHVAAELYTIIRETQPSSTGEIASPRQNSWLSFFKKTDDSQIFPFDPVMLVGDIDETAFDDVEGLLEQGGISKSEKNPFLKLNYEKIAEGGVGHVPIYAEFLTRSLLLLPGEDDTSNPWETARGFLTTFSTKTLRIPRLVFYIFSAGGGTGAGSASEIMRAQSYSRIKADIDEEIYFTGAAILPQDIVSDQRKLINTGRTIVQYLADLNIQINDKDAYYEAPDCIAGSYVGIEENEQDPISKKGLKQEPVIPWNGLAFISNDVMDASSVPLGFEQLETKANQYIAQQMFNLAAAQVPTAEFAGIDGGIPSPTKKNYQAVRLDPNDLKTGLIGPYAICFGISPSLDSTSKDSTDAVDEMFLRAIDIPVYNKYTLQSKGEINLIEGLSVAPCRKIDYSEKVAKARESLRDGLSKGSFEELSKIPFFEKCPRIIYSLTAPQEGKILNVCKERLDDLTSWLFPNLLQTRHAISWGTTTFYSLSIYIETSVLLVPDVQKAIVNYLKLCWKQRHSSSEQFLEDYNNFLKKEPPIEHDEVKEWLGEREEYSKHIPNFNSLSESYNSRWIRYVEEHCDDPKRKKKLLGHKVEDVLLKYDEVTSALRYINYAYHLKKIETINNIDGLF